MFALGTALRRGEILALRWSDVEMLERRLHVRRSSSAGRWGSRSHELVGGRSPSDREHRTCSTSSFRRAGIGRRIRSCSAIPRSGAPLDPSKVSRYMRTAIAAAGLEAIRPWHDLRHTALTHDPAAGNPAVYVSGSSRSRSGDDDRALRPRCAGRVPRRRGERGGPIVRECHRAFALWRKWRRVTW